jgi:hypothetical protein
MHAHVQVILVVGEPVIVAAPENRNRAVIVFYAVSTERSSNRHDLTNGSFRPSAAHSLELAISFPVLNA